MIFFYEIYWLLFGVSAFLVILIVERAVGKVYNKGNDNIPENQSVFLHKAGEG
jgi:hypothetical protein